MSLGLVFSPQGSQVVGMGRQLAERSAAARAIFEEADATLGWSVSGTSWEGPAERLSETRQTQPCLLTASISALRALEERVALHPAEVAGHSVGEYAALVAAGVLEFGAALRLVARRAALMTAAAADADGGMTAVIGLDRETVERVVESAGRPGELVVANDNAPGQVVISGRADALVRAEGAMRAAGARRLIRLAVSGAFHSPLMADVAEGLGEAFESETWHDARVPVVSNVTAKPVTDADRLRTLLAEQVRSPVEWVRSVRRMRGDGVDTIVELGSGAALVGMVRRIAPDVRAAAVNDLATLEEAVALVGSAAEAAVS
ncbi:MAG TPA: ACP S-malonyltransferase [Candidatus Limnocylindria bacterium]